MGELKPEVLRKQLSAGEIGRCYLFYGKERYLMDHYCRTLRTSVLGGEAAPFNYRRLEGKGLELQELRDAVDAYPSFAERTLVEVRDYDFFSAKEEEVRELTELLTGLPDYCCLLFLYDTLEFKPDKRRKKLWELLRSSAAIVEFPLQGQGELIRWVQKHFQARGREIGREEASYLLFLCGSGMENLANEIGKIAVLAPGKTVRREDIDAAAVPVAEAQAFKLADALSEKDYEKAADLMHKLFQLNTEPIVLNALIGSQLRKLYAALLVKKAGGGVQALAELLGSGSDYLPRQYLRICASFSEEWYRRMIRLSAETDLRLKSSSAVPEDLLRSLFVTMAAEA